ncbi:hypothetical protein HDF14_005045 [Edaphobacter lichenicola]|uniref:Uncharacterized protein n=1 Tax=Tunturiibacter gelidiferens TaxID=3069689 RepID=A0A9X0QJ78_9BACT|nr:hypothetical protein [Edaphobacter lichenicola]
MPSIPGNNTIWIRSMGTHMMLADALIPLFMKNAVIGNFVTNLPKCLVQGT